MSHLSEIRAIVGESGWVAPRDADAYLTEWRDRLRGEALAIVRPGTIDELQAIVKIADRAGLAIVTQGGNTGLCGGAIPINANGQILVVLNRLRQMAPVDADSGSLLVEAGCTLSAVHDAAAGNGLRFGVSLASDGSATIGGAISTNAGGIQVLRYGLMREQVLGLEVVLADGRLWSDLRNLRKSNDGYDLKQWFIGAEGTLGIITRARLKLWPAPKASSTVLLGVQNLNAAVRVLASLRGRIGEFISAAELMSARALRFVARHMEGIRSPFSEPPPFSLLLQIEMPSQAMLDAELIPLLGALSENHDVVDSVVAASAREAGQLWRLRHAISEAQKPEGVSIKHDIALPVANLAAFDREARRQLEVLVPGARPVVFGHVGDGNLHYNVSPPIKSLDSEFVQHREVIETAIYAIVDKYEGTISAEHGIGLFKKSAFERFVPEIDREMMGRLKSALDPNNRMNPGKVLTSTVGNETTRFDDKK